ncbi:HSP70/90 co-chaperone [Lithohypha guttulata]|nr:HSP70/90 co-chaperone [Lithohypha guttulata]
MVRLEELNDDVNENNVKKTSGSQPEDGDLEDLYDRAVARGGFSDKSFEEALSDLSKTPLFMTSLDDAGNEDNVVLEALKALQYEGTRSEAAQNFKEQGNECVQERKWSDAKEFYTKGIAVLTNKVDEVKWDKPEDPVEEDKRSTLLLEQLHSNRARCNLELKNYRSTTLDCSSVLKINPHNVKAHYRSASALFALDKVYEALDVCYRGLKLDQDNQVMKVLLEKIQKRSRVKEEQDRKRKDELDRKRREKLTLVAAIRARNITVRFSRKGAPEMADAELRLVPDPLSPESTLEFPTMFLYPTHNQSDFIKAFSEKDAIYQHLSYMLPLPWDAKGEYKVSTVECYMDTISGGMVKLGKKVSLLEILSNDKVEVLDGMVRIYVVPPGGQWLQELKRKRNK